MTKSSPHFPRDCNCTKSHLRTISHFIPPVFLNYLHRLGLHVRRLLLVRCLVQEKTRRTLSAATLGEEFTHGRRGGSFARPSSFRNRGVSLMVARPILVLHFVVEFVSLHGCKFGDRRVPKIAAAIADVPCDVGCTGGGGRTSTFQVSLTLFSDAQEANRGFYFKEAFDIAANPGQHNREGAMNRAL